MSQEDKVTPQPWDGQPYSVKRHGVTLTNCDSEPVQTPGCVQAHGAMLVLRPADLTILQASENTDRLLGHPAESLLNKPVRAAIGLDGEATLKAFFATEPTDHNPLYVFTLPAQGDVPPLDVTAHTIDGVAVVEFEATGRTKAGEPDYYALVKKTVARLQTARTLQEFCDLTAADFRTLTGLDRVMIYKFHADGHGEVVAESKRDDLDPWLGLHYPAEDIPQPAREVFKKVWIRPTPDVAGALAEMVPLTNPQSGRPLTMTFCALRGVSVMYTEYLKNMKVTAGLTLPIRQGNDLWGLIAGHHYAGPKFVPYQVRAACEFLAQVVSLQYQAAEEREHLVYRLKLDGTHQQLVAKAAQNGLAILTDGQPNLLDGMAAGGAALYHLNRWWRVGNTPNETELEGLGEWLNDRPEFTSLTSPHYVTDSLARDYPPAAAFGDVASGLLAVPMSRTNRNLMLWFRPETMRTVNWGGNPHDKPTVPGPNGPRLTPRRSFELFQESVRGRSVPWLTVELDSAVRLRMLIMELVVSRSERLADLNADLTRSNEELDAFAYVASHDLKEPLRGIHKYAHQLLEDAAGKDGEHRKKVEGLMRLTVRMDSLLDSLLHFSRVGRAVLQTEDTDLNEVVNESIEMVDARRAEGSMEIAVPRPLPHARCDRVRCREIFVNLLSNALKYNDQPQKRVEVGFIAPDEDHPRPGCPDGSADLTIYYVRDNGIGIAARYFEQVFKMFKRLHGRDEYGGGTGAGLTIVQKLVERHHGHVWLDSTLGVGSTFYFTLSSREGA